MLPQQKGIESQALKEVTMEALVNKSRDPNSVQSHNWIVQLAQLDLQQLIHPLQSLH